MTETRTDRNNLSSNPDIVFVNRFYAPDTSATSQILTDVAESLAAGEHRICVLTSRLSYCGNNLFPKNEILNDVEIKRIWSTKFGRNSTLGRISDYLSFYASVSLSLLFLLSKGDILIAKTDPPVLSVPLGVVARLKRAKLINWLQDVFPEVAQQMGFGSRTAFLMGILKTLRTQSLKRAAMNVVIGERMAIRIQVLGVSSRRTCVIENFTDDDTIAPNERYSPELRREWGFRQEDFVVGYSGNLGRAHNVSSILDAAERLRKERDIKFLFIGGGHLHEELQRGIENRNLSNIYFKPYQPRAKLNESLALPNLHWASLTPSLEGYIVPSKIYGVAAAGRPLLMIGAHDGEVGNILSEFRFGKCVPEGKSESIVEFILQLRNDPDIAIAMGKLARGFIECRASKKRSLNRWKSLVESISTPH